MLRERWIVRLVEPVLMLAAVGLIFTGQAHATVWAEEPSHSRMVQGRVLRVGQSSLTIETRDGHMEVLTTDEAVVRVPGVAEANLADIQVNASVVIRLKSHENGAVMADAVIVLPTRRLQNHVVRGIVTEVNAEEIAVATAEDVSAILLITDSTRLWVPGEPLTDTVELEVGDPVLALGKPAPTDSGMRALLARLIVVVSDEELPKAVIQGRALAVTQQIIVVQTRRGERAITVLPRSHIWSAAGRARSLREVRPGEQIVALGQPTELGQWIAGLVLVPGPEPLRHHRLRGLVTAIDTEMATLTVQTEQRGKITVRTSDETRYRIPGIEDPGFDDIQVGNRILAVGRFEEGSQTVFLARGIGVLVASADSAQL